MDYFEFDDVSSFIVTRNNQYIDVYEYDWIEKTSPDDEGMFLCLTNDDLNRDYGDNNSICIYKNWRVELEKSQNLMKDVYNVEYENGECIWQADNVCIPNNDDFKTCLETPEKMLSRYLNGYRSCQNIMSNITPYLTDEYTKESYIPAIMTAYHTEVEIDGYIYKGYLPAICQMMYILYYIEDINDSLALISYNDRNTIVFNGNENEGNGNYLWSSTECNDEDVWSITDGSLIDTVGKDCGPCRVLPLFML